MCSCQRTFPDSLAAALSVRRLRLQANLVKVVGVTGVEPVTLRLSSACSNQLSYTPSALARLSQISNPHLKSGMLVELRRLELLTYSLQSYRSTN